MRRHLSTTIYTYNNVTTLGMNKIKYLFLPRSPEILLSLLKYQLGCINLNWSLVAVNVHHVPTHSLVWLEADWLHDYQNSCLLCSLGAKKNYLPPSTSAVIWETILPNATHLSSFSPQDNARKENRGGGGGEDLHPLTHPPNQPWLPSVHTLQHWHVNKWNTTRTVPGKFSWPTLQHRCASLQCRRHERISATADFQFLLHFYLFTSTITHIMHFLVLEFDTFNHVIHFTYVNSLFSS